MKKNRIRYWDHKRKKTVKKEIMGRKKEWERKRKSEQNKRKDRIKKTSDI